MPSCEKCWSDAHRGQQFSVHEEYRRLIAERDRSGNPCTPEQQAGPDALQCAKCRRWASHQHCGVCMVCGWDPNALPEVTMKAKAEGV
jgi:hypothetical protein